MSRAMLVLALAGSVARAQVEFADAGALLDALETADADLTDLEADLNYVRYFEIAGDRQVRRGTVRYRARPPEPGEASVPPLPPDRRFRVDFTTLEVGSSRREERRTLIFDGVWFVDVMHADRLFVKRQVVAPGQTIDPLRLGEGPFPLPLGQKKADILDRYAADLRPVDEGLEFPNLVDHVRRGGSWAEGERGAEGPARSVQVRLVPRGEDDLEELRLWYAPDEAGRLLPILAMTLNHAGDRSFIQLLNVRRNPGVTIEASAMSTDAPGEGWDVEETAWDPARVPSAGR